MITDEVGKQEPSTQDAFALKIENLITNFKAKYGSQAEPKEADVSDLNDLVETYRQRLNQGDAPENSSYI